jgi:hypothetical protein
MSEPKYLNAGSSGEWGWHATELALRCPQLFAYHHRIKDADLSGSKAALLRGSLVHQGLAHHYARLQNAQLFRDPEEWATPEVAVAACADKLAEETGTKEVYKYLDSAQNIVGDYIAHWGSENLEVLHVEEVFTADIAGYKFTQRFDLVARKSDGRVYIFDHKTTGRIDSRVPERYTLSGQFLGMANFGKQVFGTGFGGVIINLIGCGPASGFATIGSCNFERVTASPAPNAQRLFPLSVQHARQRIADLDASGLDPWEWPKTLSEQTCITAYGKCDAYELCRWGKP